LAKPRGRFTIETYHQLRVEIKKLNALFHVVKFCIPDFKIKKTFKPFAILFRQAGKVREIQLEEAIIKEYQLPASLRNFRKELKMQKTYELNSFFIMKNPKLISELKSKFELIKPLFSKLTLEKVNEYLIKRKGSISKQLANRSLKVKELHKLRKRLKRLAYNRKSLSLPNIIHPETTERELSELLGNWHDQDIIIRHLAVSIKKGEIQQNEIGQLKKIKAKITSRNNSMLKKIYQIIHSISIP
jgi:CHAD domain-containing protein